MVIHIENLSYAWKHCKNPLSHDTCTIHLKKKKKISTCYTGHWQGRMDTSNTVIGETCQQYVCTAIVRWRKKKSNEFRLLWPFFSLLTRASKEFCGLKCHKGCKCSVQVKTYKLLSKLHFEVGWFAFLQQQRFATVNKVRENGADLDPKEGFHLD